MSFPFIVHGAFMIEPTESVGPRKRWRSSATPCFGHRQRGREDPELVRSAPHDTPVRRVDEVRAATEAQSPVDSGLIMN